MCAQASTSAASPRGARAAGLSSPRPGENVTRPSTSTTGCHGRGAATGSSPRGTNPMPFRGTDKASSSARGYGISHQRERARWKLIVDAGNAYCAQPVCVMAARWIAPGSQWCLGHTADRTAYLGPVHRACNEMDGARRGSRIAHAKRRARRHGRAALPALDRGVEPAVEPQRQPRPTRPLPEW